MNNLMKKAVSHGLALVLIIGVVAVVGVFMVGNTNSTPTGFVIGASCQVDADCGTTGEVCYSNVCIKKAWVKAFNKMSAEKKQKLLESYQKKYQKATKKECPPLVYECSPEGDKSFKASPDPNTCKPISLLNYDECPYGCNVTTGQCKPLEQELLPIPTSATPTSDQGSTSIKIIPYKITSMMWNSFEGKAVPTPQPIIDKIGKAFELWGSVTEANIKFQYDGLAAEQYDSISDIPEDGKIYIVLNSNFNFNSGEAGGGNYIGTIPTDYKKGFVFLNTKKGLYTLNYKTVTHEIGHTLGLPHTPTTSTVMTCGTPTWSDYQMFTLAEMDRTSLIDKWAQDKTYSISGKVEQSKNYWPFVFAVDIVNGHTYSTIVNNEGKFRIPLLKTGKYRLMIKGYERSAYQNPVTVSPSWYISNSESTNDPYAGTVIEIDNVHKKVSDINIKLIEQPVTFNLFHTFGKGIPFEFNHAFLRPGYSGEFVIQFIPPNVNIVSVEPYGSNPDITLTGLKKDKYNNYQVTVVVSPNAIVQGDRMIITKSDSGPIQAGLVGISIIGNQYPSYVSWPPGFSFVTGSTNDLIQYEINKPYDFSTLNPTYWKN